MQVGVSVPAIFLYDFFLQSEASFHLEPLSVSSLSATLFAFIPIDH